MAGLFMKIIRGEIPAHKVAENAYALAFLDLFPLAHGHVLVIPKVEVDAIYEVPEPYYSEVWAMARRLAPAIQSAFPCRKVGMAVIGLEVPHAHLHLVPLNEVGDLSFARPKLSPSAEELQGHAQQIRSFLEH
ncbi:MAG: HIT family protein [Bacteroidota bacterium]|jgi:histidine triad (HIT) family protein